MQNMIRRNIALAAAAICVTTIIGCGVRHTEVSGQAVFEDGTPLTLGYVCFVDTASEYSVSGKIQKDGSYSLRNNADDTAGIKPGEYKVVLGTTRLTEKVGDKYVTIDTVPPEFTEKSTTPLTVTVKSGTAMKYDIKVPHLKKPTSE
ncbi:MAG: hypothetical protein LBH00_00545 [Planctomycetaceae bacterium]|jgi:hypothetical protein|nr:hypothetical protein [Planctomycetaceae bacterium]